MNLSIITDKVVKLDDFIVFASLPDMGKVGGLVSEFLVKEISGEKFAEIKIFEKPWVEHNKGLVRAIPEIYELFVNKNRRIVIMTGKTQPQESTNLFNLCNGFLNLIKNIGNPKIIYTAGGYFQPQLVESPKVYGVSNNQEMNLFLKEKKINIFNNEIEIITWFNGVIMGMAKEMKINSIGLFGEISDTKEEQPLTAKAIVKVFSKIENISINTEQFDRDYENQMLKKNKERDSSSTKYHGPGIG